MIGTVKSLITKLFESLINQIIAIASTITYPIVDLLDIVCVAFLIYKGIQFMRETRAEQLFKGIAIMFIAYGVAKWLDMRAMSWILVNVFQYGIIVLFVVFQPELRSALERMGRSQIKNIGKGLSTEETIESLNNMIDAVCKACQSLQKKNTGALIVLERSTMLGEIVSTGTVIDATASKDLICNLFFPNSPLHDGAMIIRYDKIHAAGCILPLTQNSLIGTELGTRHRAALGVSEISDALVIVVSEETGIISVVQNGIIERDFNMATLKNVINDAVFGEEEEKNKKKSFFASFFKRGGRKI